MNYPVIRAAGFILIHAPNIMMGHGSTITVEKRARPDSQYLREAGKALRSFAEAVNYAPNQVFIGNMTPEQLRPIPRPWYENLIDGKREGKYGEIYPEDELYAAMKIADSFQLVELEKAFAARMKAVLAERNIYSEKQLALLDKGGEAEHIDSLISSGKATGLYYHDQTVGCVRAAHESDPNLAAAVMLENIAAKASGALALKNLLRKNGIEAGEIDYIIETSEEAIGDMNQRGGGNLAKAIGEVALCRNATGADLRAFCAGPAHGVLMGAALVKAGIYRHVVVMAGGSSAKLGMNSRDHVAKGMPVLEDMLGGYAVLISVNDGVNPVIRTDITGQHKISSGSSPQAVIQAVVADPLEKHNLKLTDVDVFAPELQNPEITAPAGAGDVPLANYKMIGAMAVKRGEISREELDKFTARHGVTGFAPTQGHIPSGVPLIGYIRDAILAREMERAMVIGKGSLFLGRMTDLFDGISFIIERNRGVLESVAPEREDIKQEMRAMLAQVMQDLATHLHSGEVDEG